MKTISTGLDAHLKQEVTTLCTCWKIVRQDGKMFGFTDHDQDIYFNGLVYEADTGYNRTAIASDASMSVDNLNVTGFLESDQISENDLRNGLFDFAVVYIFAVNWADLTMADIKLRRGWFGEVGVNENGSFETEIRGLHQALSYSMMESFSPECRTDFCSPKCKLLIANYTRPGTVLSATSRQVFRASQLPAVPTTGSTTVGAHRWWRIVPTGTYYTDYTGFAEIKFFDQSNAEITGGTTSAFSDRKSTGFIDIPGVIGTDYHSARARDGNNDTSWQCADGDAAHTFWQIDFGTTKDVKSIIMRAPSDDYLLAPQAFNVQYSDNGADFFFAFTADAHWSGNGQEETWTFGTPTADPIDYPTTMNALPPPFTGASTYVGGTITFTTGPNTGKTIEITAFDSTTNTVTVLEGFPYPVNQGDKFSIAQGCDKLFSTCKVYNNQLNFRGEPDVPGQDEFLSYPNASG